MATETDDDRMHTPKARLSWANQLVTPKVGDMGGKPKYSCTLIIPRTEEAWLLRFKAKCIEVAKGEWGDKAEDMIKKGKIKLPLRKGEEKDELDGYDDTVVFFGATSIRQPQIVDRRKTRVEPDDDSLVYSGAYVRASIRLYATSKGGTPRVCVGLGNLQWLAHGERLGGGGGVSAEDDFDDLGDDGEAGDDDGDPLF